MKFAMKVREERKPANRRYSYSGDSSSSGTYTDSSFTPTPSPSEDSRAFTVTDEQTKDILGMLRQSIDMEEWQLKEDNKFDNAIHVENVFKRFKKEDDEEDELASNAQDRKDEIRLAHLEETRPAWLTRTLKILFHVCVFVNFFMSWYDSTRLLLEDAKMDIWLLEDDYNCLQIVPNVDWLDHTMNILHALLSSSVLFVHKRSSATLCLAWIGSQACHTIFKTFQYFYNLKFETREIFSHIDGLIFLVGILALDVLCALLLLHKYYDLTDRFRTRAKYFGTTDTSERSLNDKIIYKNDTSFLQRKNILRDVTTAQTYAIIKKMGKHAKQGIHVDPVSLDREINAARLALADCATADNSNMLSMLKQAYAHRLKELEQADQETGQVVLNTMMARSDIY